MTAARTYTPKSRITDIVWKPLIMLAVVAAAFTLVYFTPARKYIGDIESVKYWLLSLGWVAPHFLRPIVKGFQRLIPRTCRWKGYPLFFRAASYM
jgi:hypothetical protein